MAYDFRALSPTDFEDLVRSLLQEELGFRIEAFGRGRDQGIDLRFATALQGKVIVQAKHYVDTGYNGLRASIKKESLKVVGLNPSRYILATSVPMTVQRKDELISELAPFVLSPLDVIGPEDLNALLTKHSKVERSFYKLWITSTNVLERILHNATFVASEDEAARIERVVRLYVDTGSLEVALKMLEEKRLIIISGAPGVGKSTLARILAWHFMSADWQLISVESFDQALSVFDKHHKQVFFFDDFMGQIRLSSTKIDQTDEKLLKFIERVQKSPNSFFILTSREYILKQAQYQSQKIGDKRVDLRTYTIDIGAYHRTARAKILYNHVYFSDMTNNYRDKLLVNRYYLKIISHKNFSPRLIESLTSKELVESIPLDDYIAWVESNLNNPTLLWQLPFRAHLSRQGRALVECMFFEADGVAMDVLHGFFMRANRSIARENNWSTDSLDWPRAVKETEGTFIHISNGRASFPNPSLRDFLDKELAGSEDVICILAEARGSRNIQRLIDHVLANARSYEDSHEALANAARIAVKELLATPLTVERALDWGGQEIRARFAEGLSVAARVSLALKLWNLLQDPELATLAEQLSLQFSEEDNSDVAFNENIAPMELLATKPFGKCPTKGGIAAAVMKRVFEDPYKDGGRPAMRDMAQMTEFLSLAPDKFPEEVKRLSDAAGEAFAEIEDEISGCMNLDDLNTLRWQVDRLAELLEVDASEFDEMFEEREAELQEEDYDRDDLPSEGSGPIVRDDSDDAIVSLFSTLN